MSRFLIMTKHTSEFPAMLVMASKHSTVAKVISIESNIMTGTFDAICSFTVSYKGKETFTVLICLFIYF